MATKCHCGRRDIKLTLFMNGNFKNALTNDDWFILYFRGSYIVEPKDMTSKIKLHQTIESKSSHDVWASNLMIRYTI